MYLLHRSVGPSVQFLYSGCMIAAKFRIMTIEQRAVRGTAENFVICDTQKSYSENLFRRLSEKLSGYFQFHVFHDIENLKIAAKSMQVNILLIGEEYGKEDRDEIPARQKYLLIGEKIPNERSPTEIPFFRYQSVSSMLELLLQEKNQENSEVQTHQIQLTELQLPLETVTELPPLAKELNFTIENYKYCEMPKKKEDILTIKLLTGAGEIQGIRFESKDNGETWAYAGISVE